MLVPDFHAIPGSIEKRRFRAWLDFSGVEFAADFDLSQMERQAFSGLPVHFVDPHSFCQSRFGVCQTVVVHSVSVFGREN
jgi:hypothetical protein